MNKILITKEEFKNYLEKALKYDALVEYDVNSWHGFYDALDAYKNEDYDLENDDASVIEDFSKLVNVELQKYEGENINGKYN